LEQEVMKALLEAFEQSDWQEMTVTIGGDRLHISRLGSTDAVGPPPAAAPTAAAPTAAPAPEAAESGPAPEAAESGPAPEAAKSSPPPEAPESAPPPEVPESAPSPETNGTLQIPPGVQVTAPSVGLFWRAPSPGAPPFVEVGKPVTAGDTVAIVEVMKLMNHVTATVSGTVAAVLAENGQAVEFGQVLVVIDGAD
jgi:acetyl-CoA carboxylase biotin carboxyl carrier protein